MSRLRNLIRNERGAAAMMFGLAAVPITVAAGGALDFTRAGVGACRVAGQCQFRRPGRRPRTKCHVGPARRHRQAVFPGERCRHTCHHGADGADRGSHSETRDMKTTLLTQVGKKTLSHRGQGQGRADHDRPARLRHRAQQDGGWRPSISAATAGFNAPTCAMYSNSNSVVRDLPSATTPSSRPAAIAPWVRSPARPTWRQLRIRAATA